MNNADQPAAKDREIEELKVENAHLHAEKFIVRPEELEKENVELKTQLGSKDKELMAMANITRQTELSLKLQVEAKETELAQLKEFQIWFYKKQFGFETDKSAQSNIDSDYAEWYKQNKAKAK